MTLALDALCLRCGTVSPLAPTGRDCPRCQLDATKCPACGDPKHAPGRCATECEDDPRVTCACEVEA